MSREDEIPDSDRAGSAPLPRETTALFGLETAELELLDGYRRGRLAQAWILGGPEGIGKATLAWRFARFLLANPDPASAAVRQATSLAVDPQHPVARRIAAGGHGNIFRLRREWNEKTKKLRTEIQIDSVRECISMFHQSAAVDGWRACIVDNAEELNEVGERLKSAGRPVLEEAATTCCYAQSSKNWITDPDGVIWETFLTTGEHTEYGNKEPVLAGMAQLAALETAKADGSVTGSCCTPSQIA